jgi:hypothetical protein
MRFFLYCSNGGIVDEFGFLKRDRSRAVEGLFTHSVAGILLLGERHKWIYQSKHAALAWDVRFRPLLTQRVGDNFSCRSPY